MNVVLRKEMNFLEIESSLKVLLKYKNLAQFHFFGIEIEYFTV